MSYNKYYRTLTLPLTAGNSVSLAGFPSATIYATSAPTSAYTLEVSPDNGASWIPQATVKNSATEITVSPTLDAQARYILSKGDCLIRITGGTGGAFLVVAGE
jgi:hypothetical protein